MIEASRIIERPRHRRLRLACRAPATLRLLGAGRADRDGLIPDVIDAPDPPQGGRFGGVEVSARDVSTLLPGSEFRNAWLFVARGFSAVFFWVADGNP